MYFFWAKVNYLYLPPPTWKKYICEDVHACTYNHGETAHTHIRASHHSPPTWPWAYDHHHCTHRATPCTHCLQQVLLGGGWTHGPPIHSVQWHHFAFTHIFGHYPSPLWNFWSTILEPRNVGQPRKVPMERLELLCHSSSLSTLDSTGYVHIGKETESGY